MNRRDLLKVVAALPFAGVLSSALSAACRTGRASRSRSRVRPGDPGWPSPAKWDELNLNVGGHLLELESPFADCGTSSAGEACRTALAHLDNPFFLGDEPALTQTSGWVDAWESRPSAYAVAARSTSDVVAAVNFAREHHLRLVVKGGGHSYQGRSDAPDSLLVWTRHMNAVTMHDAFVGQGCEGRTAPQPAVTVEAGAMWIDAYDAVTTRGGRYVQGGGCTTVGVAGLIQSGGFGSFSKNYGTAAAGLIEAEVVTADGAVRIANACTNPDLFWGLKGGGGGSLGVVTRLTLRTRELPEFFGAVFGNVRASSDAAYRDLIEKTISFYHEHLFNPHWGEQIRFRTDNTVALSLLFQGLDQQRAQAIWSPFEEWVADRPEVYSLTEPMQVVTLPAHRFWDIDFLAEYAPGSAVADDRPGVPSAHYFWAGDGQQAGQFVHGYQSVWLPASLLETAEQSVLADALFAATRHWELSLHFNKGLAGAPPEAIAAAADTATNPQVLDAFALVILGAEGPPAYPRMPGAEPDLVAARQAAAGIARAADELRRIAPGAGSYVSESDYFLREWKEAFWGTNYPRLADVKRRFDPDGLFFVRHGVGSDAWSDDGFMRRSAEGIDA